MIVKSDALSDKMKEGLHGQRGHLQFSWQLFSFTSLTLLFGGLMQKQIIKLIKLKRLMNK